MNDSNYGLFDEEHNANDEELLAGKVLGDLSDEESRQVDGLLSLGHGHYSQLLQELEITAAAVGMALDGAQVADASRLDKHVLPAELKHKIVSSAPQFLASGDNSPAVTEAVANGQLGRAASQSGFSTDAIVPEKLSSAVLEQEAVRRASNRREMFAWLACVAASLFAAALLMNQVANIQPTVQTASVTSQRKALLANAGDLVTINWAGGPTPFPTAVQGDVVWSNAAQMGFMRFVGMPVNDASVEQYQLWIIDPARDDEPIDGGVFDISSEGEVIVPIDAKLQVLDPAAFAITIEKPGGVVVSTQERLPLLAAAG